MFYVKHNTCWILEIELFVTIWSEIVQVVEQ